MMKKLILAALLFCGVGAYGQAYQQNGTFGIQFKRLATDSGFNLPKGDTSLNNSLNRGGAIIYKSSNQKLYFHNGSYWIPLTSGAASILNFANTDLSFDAERIHTINGFDLTVQNSLAAKGGYFKLFSGGSGIYGAKNSSNLFTGLQANATQSLSLMTNDNDRITIASNGRIRFDNYNLGDSVLSTDGSGNLVGKIANNKITVGNDIQAVLDTITRNTTLVLKSQTYILNDALVLPSNYSGVIDLNGATLKRAAQTTTTLTVGVTSSSTTLQVASVPSGWKVGDELQLYTDNTVNTSTAYYGMYISTIVGTTITLIDSVGKNGLGVNSSWGIGATVRKIYPLITSNFSDLATRQSGDYYPDVTEWKIINGTIDGNRSNNAGNYYWGANPTAFLVGKNTFENVYFVEIPNDNITSYGVSIINCKAKNLNASLIHFSYTREKAELVKATSVVTGCLVDSSNLITDAVNGHTKGVIEFSFTAGRNHVHHNFFYNGAGSVIGVLQAGVSSLDGGTRDFTFDHNYAFNFKSVINAIDASTPIYANSRAGSFIISDNIFDSCGYNDYEFNSAWKKYDTVKILNNITNRGTILKVGAKARLITNPTGVHFQYYANDSSYTKVVPEPYATPTAGITNQNTLTLPSETNGRFQATLSKLVDGAIPFGHSSGFLNQNSGNFFWDNTNKRLGIGRNAPVYRLHVEADYDGVLTVFRRNGGSNNPGTFFSVDEASGTSTIAFSGSSNFNGAIKVGGSIVQKYFKSLNVAIGDIADDGVNLLQIGGAAKLTGTLTGTSATFSGTVKLAGYTVATLPTGIVGMTAYVTDALAPTFGATLVGGGAVVTKAFFNGTNWVNQ